MLLLVLIPGGFAAVGTTVSFALLTALSAGLVLQPLQQVLEWATQANEQQP
ncbi:MAG: hypothetical protein OXN44_13380 [Acidimicrobiaceae bacterium]|nr:hypothetical protein [Acidimicrobiaceae bacterium]